MTKKILNTEINEVENKIPNHDKYIAIAKFNMLTVESFAARLKQVNLVTKTDFDNKLTSYNKQIDSNKKYIYKFKRN